MPVETWAAAIGRLSPALRDRVIEAADVHCPGAYTISVVAEDTVTVMDTAAEKPRRVGVLLYLPQAIVAETTAGVNQTLVRFTAPPTPDDYSGYMQQAVDWLVSKDR